MKIAISSTGKDLKSEVAGLFGRCPYFLIVEIKGEKIQGFEAVENTSSKQTGGAGVSAAQIVAEKNVNAVVTGNIGPRALDVFRQFNIDVYNGSGQANEVVHKFMEGKLERTQ